MKQIGLDDKQPFLPIEQSSKLEYLLAGRSGIYIVPEKPDPISADTYLPKRGTALPGNFFTYNEWDFNAAGSAFEKLTGKDIYDALETDLARPIGMQDFDRTQPEKNQQSPILRASPIPHVRLHARPDRWGFGLMWFVWDEPGYFDQPWTGPMQGASSRWDRVASTSPYFRASTWSSRTKSTSTLPAARSIPSNGTRPRIWFSPPIASATAPRRHRLSPFGADTSP